MYTGLLHTHNLFRYLVLLLLVFSIVRAYRGQSLKLVFTKRDNSIRVWTAMLVHIQLLIGIFLYFKSPITKYFWANFDTAIKQKEMLFWGLTHLILMLVATILLTIGSAKAKRKESDHQKFKTMFVWFTVVLIIIIIAIPWPFSPLSSRSYF